MAQKLGEILLEKGICSREELREARSEQVLYGDRLGTNLLALGLIDEQHLAQALAYQQGVLPFWGPAEPDLEVLSAIPRRTQVQTRTVPLARSGSVLVVLTTSPHDVTSLDAVRFAWGGSIRVHVGAEARVWDLLSRLHGAKLGFRPVRFSRTRPRPGLARLDTAPHVQAPELTSEEDFAEMYADAAKSEHRATLAAMLDAPGATEPVERPDAAAPDADDEVLELAELASLEGAPIADLDALEEPEPDHTHHAPPHLPSPNSLLRPTRVIPRAAPALPLPQPQTLLGPAAADEPILEAVVLPEHSPAHTLEPVLEPAALSPTTAPPTLDPRHALEPLHPPGQEAAHVELLPDQGASATANWASAVDETLVPEVAATTLEDVLAGALPADEPAPDAAHSAPSMHAALTALAETAPQDLTNDPSDLGNTAPADDTSAEPAPADDPSDPSDPEDTAPPLSIADAIAALPHAHSRDAIADLVLRAGASVFQRVALLTVHTDHVVGWCARGDGMPAVLSGFQQAADAPGVFASVLSTRAHWVGPLTPHKANGAWLKATGRKLPRSVVVIPVLARGDVVNLVYGDDGHGAHTSPDVADLLLLAQHMAERYQALLDSPREQAAARLEETP